MRAVVQRVKEANVKVDGITIGEIKKGLVILLGIKDNESIEEKKYIVDKISNLRIFEDEDEKMNLSIKDIGGEVLLVPNFTIYGDCRKGRRPSFAGAARPEEAEVIYEELINLIKLEGINVETGKFRAEMEVNIVNDGPVTVVLDSEKNI
ncbi:MAG: D-aminoacyl-tRNA deacylase [Clostridia bacterium]|jgi:D-tyrosyl-tRNA(Tyr) deacylase|nr:D-aminoacyl-tRNA deacylase [Clostridia bacterium]